MKISAARGSFTKGQTTPKCGPNYLESPYIHHCSEIQASIWSSTMRCGCCLGKLCFFSWKMMEILWVFKTFLCFESGIFWILFCFADDLSVDFCFAGGCLSNSGKQKEHTHPTRLGRACWLFNTSVCTETCRKTTLTCKEMPIDPLVNVYITMENHHVRMGKPTLCGHLQ